MRQPEAFITETNPSRPMEQALNLHSNPGLYHVHPLETEILEMQVFYLIRQKYKQQVIHRQRYFY
jgi:hypothetical protein